MRSLALISLAWVGLVNAASASSDWDAAVGKANDFLSQLTLAEKTAVVTGANPLTGLGCIGSIGPISRLNFSGICFSDGSSGVNRADLTSVFPAGLTTAATWDRDLMYQRAAAIGDEFRAKGMHVVLGPVAGPLGRHPLGGRNWEGFSADPYLTGVAMDHSIRGFQSTGVQAVAKHYIGNEQETQRTNLTLADGTNIDAVSSNMDDRTLHEVYLWPFVDAINAKPAAVMCSYNRFNQTYTCENSKLLNGILRDELGFEGYTVSDWYATHSTEDSINAGLDMEMPGTTVPGQGVSWFGDRVAAAVENGTVSTDRLDEMVRRIMTQYYLLGQDITDYPTLDPSSLSVIASQYQQELGSLVTNPPARDVRGDHATLIRQVGAAGAVLLKNVNGTLPLVSPANIGVFGNDAGDLTDGLVYQDPPATNVGFEYGTLDIGGGSSSVRHTYVVTPLEAIKARARQTNARVQYILNNERLAVGDFHSIYPVPDVCIVFLKTFAAEGFDRVSFEADWNSTAVVNQVADKCNNTVVVTHSVGVNTMPWANHTNVRAIIAAHLPGEETGNSIADILWGDVNPSGRLPYTIPVQEADYDIPIANLTSDEVTYPGAWQSNFTDGLLIDYRHFDALDIEPLYEFGFGLSYTTFELTTDLSITPLSSAAPDPLPAGNQSNPLTDFYAPLVNVTAQVANTGDRDGASVVQLYLSMPSESTPAGTPVRVLRGFEKAQLATGEAKSVVFQLSRRDLSYWSTVDQAWRIPAGQFQVQVGFSSRDLPKSAQLSIL
ncbi:hypothetical protein PFICI_14249 [Pestalotiopsis fici W106-1]|uniref:Beta-glucosidase cel3A n=1 Tax=Pestalotiopsis fici (strain W106-1 / CGMCC3.15140) TaxID=1229662 RepID=W3WKH9_PESFW|nr:uncharacterized protein PFICI_14249 [Pestalotiopsis fici W106-1]ETS74383.1 hypothetical protein PFICI_14249 [Pestalotiopsis fici W106-1]